MWGNHTARGRLTPRGGERVTPPVSAQRRGQVSERVGESPRPWDSARAHVCTTGWQPALRPGRPVSVGITSLQSSPYLEPSAPTHTVLMVCVARPPRGMPHTLLARAPCCVWHPSLRLAAKHAPTAPVHAHPLSLPLQARAGHRRWQRPCWRRAQAVSVPSGLDVAGEASRPPPPVGEVAHFKWDRPASAVSSQSHPSHCLPRITQGGGGWTSTRLGNPHAGSRCQPINTASLRLHCICVRQSDLPRESLFACAGSGRQVVHPPSSPVWAIMSGLKQTQHKGSSTAEAPGKELWAGPSAVSFDLFDLGSESKAPSGPPF